MKLGVLTTRLFNVDCSMCVAEHVNVSGIRPDSAAAIFVVSRGILTTDLLGASPEVGSYKLALEPLQMFV
jgi:hypothetical protein